MTDSTNPGAPLPDRPQRALLTAIHAGELTAEEAFAMARTAGIPITRGFARRVRTAAIIAITHRTHRETV